MTVYVSIGNSDNKLTQSRWAFFCRKLERTIRNEAIAVHGVWYSLPNAGYQNMCICFEAGSSVILKANLIGLAKEFSQDSIAWMEGTVEFLEP